MVLFGFYRRLERLPTNWICQQVPSSTQFFMCPSWCRNWVVPQRPYPIFLRLIFMVLYNPNRKKFSIDGLIRWTIRLWWRSWFVGVAKTEMKPLGKIIIVWSWPSNTLWARWCKWRVYCHGSSKRESFKMILKRIHREERKKDVAEEIN